MAHNQLNNIGTMTFASGIALVGDPCYIKDKEDIIWMMAEAARTQDHCKTDAGFAFPVPTTPATVFIEAGREGTSSRMLVSFTGHDFRDWHAEDIGYAGVDSGQMMASDMARIVADYKDDEYQDIRIYRNKIDGRLLQYRVDFANYESPIPSENGHTMNTLNATGEWEQMPDGPDQFTFTYNGVCKYNKRADDTGAIIEGSAAITGSGGGDGSYPVTLYRNSEQNLIGFMIDFAVQEAGYDDEEEEEDEGEE